jgi:hypothetical protein
MATSLLDRRPATGSPAPFARAAVTARRRQLIYAVPYEAAL